MTDIKPCTVKGCKFAGYHHHATANNTCHREGAASQCLPNCGRQGGDLAWTATVSPRLTRKALNARIAALEAENADLIERGWADEKVICDMRAENADLHAEIADKKDRLARCEGVVRFTMAWPTPAETAREIEAALTAYRTRPVGPRWRFDL